MKSALKTASPGAKYSRGSGSHYMLGPVKDFAAFCTALSWATIVERDDERRIVKVTIDQQKYERAGGVVHLEIVNYDEIRKQQNEQLQSGTKGRTVSRAAKPSTRPIPRDYDLSGDWRLNLGTLLNHTAKPTGNYYGGRGSRLEMAGITNLDEFCKKLDFVEITERDEANSMLRIKVDPQKLTKEAVVKHIDVAQLKPHERRQTRVGPVVPGTRSGKVCSRC